MNKTAAKWGVVVIVPLATLGTMAGMQLARKSWPMTLWAMLLAVCCAVGFALLAASDSKDGSG